VKSGELEQGVWAVGYFQDWRHGLVSGAYWSTETKKERPHEIQAIASGVIRRAYVHGLSGLGSGT
jgi:hypothetical protein